MADDASCARSVWYTSRLSGFGRSRENGTGAADGYAGRSPRVREIFARLEERGDEVFLEIRNGFEARGSRSGSRVAGRPDIIARSPDSKITVYGVNTGESDAADIVRVKLFMYLLPRSNHGRWRGTTPAGCVLYVDGTERRVKADEIDEEFREKVADVMRHIVSDEPARYVPSASECGRCMLTAEDCSEGVEAGSRSPDGDRPGGPSSTC